MTPDESEYIYREGRRKAKEVSLHKDRDYRTGLSFLNYDMSPTSMKFKISKLQGAGYIVVRDGGTNARELPFFGGELFYYYDDIVPFDKGHVTVYHPDKTYWTEWHEADKANLNSPNISPQLQSFYNLREIS